MRYLNSILILIGIAASFILAISLLRGNFAFSPAASIINRSDTEMHERDKSSNNTIVVRALRNHWNFDPKIIEVTKGDHVILKIFNEDDYDHGFASEALGINKRLPPKTETVVEFDAEKEGIFPFYCSIVCGQGHYQMTGRIVVTE